MLPASFFRDTLLLRKGPPTQKSRFTLTLFSKGNLSAETNRAPFARNSHFTPAESNIFR